MTTWILILWIHTGVMADTNSMALATVNGFQSKTACESAGAQAVAMTRGTVKDSKFICVQP